jgi:hypothetical protein
MRRRPSEAIVNWPRYISSLLLPAALLMSGQAAAQGSASNDGALFLLIPVGARSASLGQAVSASSLGGESVWWNPSGLSELTRSEVLLHHSQSIIGTGDALTIAIPFRVVGVVALSASTINFGEQEVSDGSGGPTGLLVPRSFVFAATYATTLGSLVRAGLTYKLLQMRADCSGACTAVESFAASSSALDFGLRYGGTATRPLAVGFVVRNVGPRLQVVDKEQADALPSRLHLGIDYRILAWESSVKDSRLHFTAEAVDRLKIAGPTVRIGTELRYQEKFFLRGGYMFEEGAGGSLGGGIIAGNFSIDIGRVLGGLSADIGEPPTFVSLRFRFR